MVPDTPRIEAEAEALCATARWCYERGWVPATGGNFSVRDGARMLISPSGLDKGVMATVHLLEPISTGARLIPVRSLRRRLRCTS